MKVLLRWVKGEISIIEELEEDILPVEREAIIDDYGAVLSRCRLAYGP